MLKKDKIELEDLWRLAPKKIKLLLPISFIFCLCLYPIIQTPQETDKNKIKIVVAKNSNSNNFKLQTLNELNFDTHTPIIRKSIFSEGDKLCFSKTITPNEAVISCPKFYGILKEESHYKVDNNKPYEATYRLKPTTPTQITLALLLWLLAFVLPSYFWTKKNTDLSSIEKRVGKRKNIQF